MCIDPRAPAVLRNGKVIRQQWQKRLNKTVKERAIRSGRDDVVFFSTSEDKTETRGPDLGTSLEFLGALQCPQGKPVRRCVNVARVYSATRSTLAAEVFSKSPVILAETT